METRYFEDWKVGDRIETLGRTVGDAEISQFVGLSGMFEELFMNEEYVKKSSLYPRRFAPGALIFAFTEGLIILSGCIHGVGLALVALENMTFRRPLFAGDTMRVRVEVIETRASSRGDRGLVTFRHTVLNQEGETVMECTVKRMLRGRNFKISLG
ncbi:MAG TPA: MaoC family dehydratase N-terminal domain-containing protein [Candidatus Binataceae bacterium]|nr:MaoC family dehydratase N-terminal domain-containing protein [Candidatus Binataceae bacterium]